MRSGKIRLVFQKTRYTGLEKRKTTGRQVLLQRAQTALAVRAQKYFTIEEKTLDAEGKSVPRIVIANALSRFGIWFLRSLTEETEGYLTPCQIRM